MFQKAYVGKVFLYCVVNVTSGCIFLFHPVCKRYVCVCTAVRVSEDTLGRIIICFVPLKSLPTSCEYGLQLHVVTKSGIWKRCYELLCEIYSIL